MARKYFGTDGIRGKVGEFPITPEFVMKLGWAAGRVLSDGQRGKVLIGKDTRISGYMFESALEAGFSAAGLDIHLLGPMPTPAVAYLTRTLHADAGIVISASHNAFEDNGFKFFASNGMKLPDDIEAAIEAELERPMTVLGSAALGKAVRVADAGGRYIEFCKSTAAPGTELDGIDIVVDCANGATYHVAAHVFTELGARVTAMGTEPDGLNINRGCGSTHPETLRKAVCEQGADVGIAFDGDGDRVIMVDHTGAVVDGDELLYVIASDLCRRGADFGGGVVGTLMSNLGLEHALTAAGIGFQRAKVGDRYVLEMMQSRGWRLGGESSGHIICLDCITTGDGIVSALQVLSSMAATGKSLYDLRTGMTKYPQVLKNVRLSGTFDAMASPQVMAAVHAVEEELGADGRVLLRPSGTEPVIRVMVEGREQAQVERLTSAIASAVEEAMHTEAKSARAV